MLLFSCIRGFAACYLSDPLPIVSDSLKLFTTRSRLDELHVLVSSSIFFSETKPIRFRVEFSLSRFAASSEGLAATLVDGDS